MITLPAVRPLAVESVIAARSDIKRYQQSLIDQSNDRAASDD